MRSVAAAALLLLLIVEAFLPHCVGAAVVRIGQPVMGTVLQVTVVLDDRKEARRLATAAIRVARRWEDVLTTWRADGELAQLNARAGKGPAAISAELAGSLRRMRILSSATGGAFDPGVGRLVARWRLPAASIGGVPQGIGSHRIESALTLGRRQAELTAGTAIDAGGIGKGIALDAAGRMLRKEGVRAAFLDFGGSSQLAIGAPPGNPGGWLLLASGLRPGAVAGTIPLRSAALSTSRASGSGSAAGPIIDPLSGRPVGEGRTATVLAADATTAEAWSTALVVLGRDGLIRLAEAGLAAFVEDDIGRVLTPGFPLEAGPGPSHPSRPGSH